MWPFNRKKKLSDVDKREIRRRLSEPRTLYGKQNARQSIERHYAEYDDSAAYISAVWFEVGASDMESSRIYLPDSTPHWGNQAGPYWGDGNDITRHGYESSRPIPSIRLTERIPSRPR
jgi:hypothetical protein